MGPEEYNACVIIAGLFHRRTETNLRVSLESPLGIPGVIQE